MRLPHPLIASLLAILVAIPVLLAAPAAAGQTGASEAPDHSAAAPHRLRVAVLGEADDSRVAAAGEAIAWWNARLAAADADLRLELEAVRSSPIDDAFYPTVETGPATVGQVVNPGDLSGVDGDIVLAFPDVLFVSFTHDLADGRPFVAVRVIEGTRWDRPGMAANLIAHELGHALGLRHGSDPSRLMCGRPADCTPERFADSGGAILPLDDEHLARLPNLARIVRGR